MTFNVFMGQLKSPSVIESYFVKIRLCLLGYFIKEVGLFYRSIVYYSAFYHKWSASISDTHNGSLYWINVVTLVA